MTDEYALRHLAEHLFRARWFDELYALLEHKTWYRAKRDYDISHRAYLHDVEYGFRAAQWEGATGIARLTAYAVVRATLGTLASNLMLPISETIVKTGRDQILVANVDLIPDPLQRAQACRTFGEVLITQGKHQRAVEILTSGLKAAQEIPDGATKARTISEFGTIISRMGRLGETRQAASLALAAVEAIDADETLAKVEALSQVASILIEIDERQWAIEVLTQALHTVQETHARVNMKDIAGNLIVLGEYELAWKAVGEIWVNSYRSSLNFTRKEIELFEFEGARNREKPYHIQAWDEFKKDEAEAMAWIASAYARAGASDYALKVLDEIEDKKIKTEALWQVADGLAHAGALAQALALAKGIEDKAARALALWHVALALDQAGQKEQSSTVLMDALHVTTEIGREVGRATILGKIAEGFVRVGVPAQAMTIIDQAADPKTKMYVRKTLVLALAEADRIDQAVSVAEHIKDKSIRVEMFIAIAQALVQRENHEQAQRVLRRAIHWAEQTEHRDALFEIARTLNQAGAREEARKVVLAVLELAKSMRTYPTRCKIFGEAAQILAQAGKSYQAVALIPEIQTKEVRVETIHRLIQTLAQAGDLELVSDLALELTQLDGYPYNWSTQGLSEQAKYEAMRQFARILAQIEACDEALLLVQQMKHEESRKKALEDIGRAYIRLGDAGRVLGVAEKLDWVPSADLLLEIVDALAEQQAFERALAVIDTILLGEGQIRALSNLAPALAQAQGTQRARELLRRARAIVRTLHWEGSRTKALEQIARAWAELQDYEQALAVAGAIEEPEAKALAYCRLAQHLRRAVSSGKAPRPKGHGFYERLRAVWWKPLRERGTPASPAGAELSPVQVTPLLSAALAELGKWDYRTDVDALVAIGSILQEIGGLDELLSVAERIDDQEVKTKALAVIAVAFLRDGDDDRAGEIFSRAISTAGELKQKETLYSPNKAVERYPYRWARNGILLTMIQVGEQARSGKLLSRAFAIVKKINTFPFLDNGNEMLEHMGLAFIATGDYSSALEAAERAEGKEVKSKIAHRAARALAQEGDLERARAIVRDREGRISSSGWKSIVEGCVRGKDFEQALTMIDRIGRGESRWEALSDAAVKIAEEGRLDDAMNVIAQIEDDEAKERAIVGITQVLAVEPFVDEVSTVSICGRILYEAATENRAHAWGYIGALASTVAKLGGRDLLMVTWRHIETMEDLMGISAI